MNKLSFLPGLLACLASGWLLNNSARADDIAPQGTGIIGVKAAIDGTPGFAHENAGVAGNVNDGDINSRVDTWFGGGGANDGPVSYAGVVWPYMRYDKIRGVTLTLATFLDGGWFGVSGFGPGEGNPLEATNLIAPVIQVSTNSGASWTTVAATSDYLTTLTGFSIGGGANPNPNPVTVNFTFGSVVTGINGLRVIGENGGNAGTDANGFLGVFELEVNADAPVDTDGDGFSDAMELAFGGDPNDPNIFPSNFALIGMGIIGTMPSVDSGAGTETPYTNAGVTNNINDGVPTSRVDTWNNAGTDTASYVGILWNKNLTHPLVRLELTFATFLDGGWFGPNNAGPGPGGLLNANYLTEPIVQVTRDGGGSWTTIDHTSDYLTALNGHAIGGGAVPNPSSVTAAFTLTNANSPNGVSGINGIRIVGSEGGTASGGFLGVFELATLTGTTDSDHNGLPDDWERQHFGHLGVDPNGDADNDGLSNLDEYKAGTDPQLADTDTDGLSDGDEVHKYHTDPLKIDTDGDTLSDGDEVLKYHTDPLKKDTDGDGFTDAMEVSMNTDPLDPNSYPDNIAPLGTGIMGTRTTIDSGPDTPLYHAGAPAAINDGNLTTSVDTFGSSDSFSYVGILWDHPITNPIVRLELNLATFFDGGWFGVSGFGPDAGGILTAAEYLSEPIVQVTRDGGTNWTTITDTSDYMTALDGHPLPAVAFGTPTLATANFQLATPQTGINGILIAGSEGGTASGGFLGVFELAVHVQLPPAPLKLLNVTQANGQLQFQFDSKTNTTYTVQYQTAVGTRTWQTLSTIAGDGTRKQVTDTMTDSKRFYRVSSP